MSTTPARCPITANITTRCPKPIVAYSWWKLRDVDASQFEKALRQSELLSSPATTADEFAAQLDHVITSQLDEVVAPIQSRSPDGCRLK